MKNHAFEMLFIMLFAGIILKLLNFAFPNPLFAISEKETKIQNGIIVDSLLLSYQKNYDIATKPVLMSGIYALAKIDSAKDNFVTIANADEKLTVIEDTSFIIDNMQRFFEKILSIETKKEETCRIAWFGDSMNENDYIVKTVRKLYQKKFGGYGYGIISITTPFEGTSKFEYSSDWQNASMLKRGEFAFGITGNVSFTKEQSDKTYLKLKSGYNLTAPSTLLFGKSDNNSGKIIVKNGDKITEKSLDPKNTLNFIHLAPSTNKLEIDFVNTQNIPFYGINSSNSKGIFIDNFAMRGSSGLPLVYLNKNIMNSFNQKYKYDLIVLEFGVNVLKQGVSNYDWYGDAMVKVANHLRKCFPSADILFLSSLDKAEKYGMKIKTDTTLKYLIDAQKAAAIKSNSAFIDMFDLMGGENTIVGWLKADPPLASTDYTHLTSKGFEFVGNLIFDELETRYSKYKERKK